MKGSGWILIDLGSLCLLAGLCGCFTEVGNPDEEIRMSAQFRIDYSPSLAADTAGLHPDSITISQFSLRVQEAVYHSTDSTVVKGYLWRDSVGIPVDFTGTNPQAVLPTALLKTNTISDLEMVFGIAPRKTVAADTVDFNAFKDSAYVKGGYNFLGVQVEFLFALPDSAKTLSLTYPKTSLDKWHQGNLYQCQFTFLATLWISGMDPAQVQIVKDKAGNNLAILDPEHNVAVYKELKAQFYQSFNSQTAY